MSNLLKFNLLVLLSVVMFGKMEAQYLPYFKNYTFSKYNVGNQNWDVSRSKNGKVYVANNKGLLEYDGLVWNFKELPNKTIVRSVFVHNDLIYTGSYEEFGYWKNNDRGDLFYTSLSDLIKKDISTDEEFWQILLYNDIIVFKSFSNIYLYYPDKTIKKLNLDNTLMSCSVVDDKLYLSTLSKGVFVFNKNKEVFVLDFFDERLKGSNIISINRYNKNNLIIVTSLKGCFLYDGKKLTSVNFKINNTIKEHQLNKFSVLKDGRFVFGTIKNGVYLTDHKGNLISHISKESGLINNTVLGQRIDYDGKIWLALDNGLAFIDLRSNAYFFNDISGKLATVYDVKEYKGTIYIGSNTGLFYIDKENKLQFVKGTQGQVWSLKEISGSLICGHNKGTFLVKDNTVELISSYTGGWVIKKVPELQNTYIQGTYAGLVKFTKNQIGKWETKHLGKTTMPIEYLVFEDKKTAWAAHAYKGVYKISFDKDYNVVEAIKSYKEKGIGSDYNVRVYKIKNDICFKTNEGWKKYEPLIDSIVPYKLINDNWGKDSYVISEEGIDQLFYKDSENIITFNNRHGDKEKIILNNTYFKDRLTIGYEKISKINDSIYALNLKNGFMFIDIKTSQKSHLYKPEIGVIKINNKAILSKETNSVEMNYNQQISVLLSSSKSENFFFEYAFLNKDSSKWYRLDKNVLELTTINSGNYNIGFKTVNNLGESSVTHLKLKVLLPWYKSLLGYLLYGFILMILIFILILLNKKKVARDQRVFKIKLQKEHQKLLREKALENDKKMIELKNESLKNELKLKSKQLANTAIALIKKNESLQEVKKELEENKNNIDNKYLLKKLVKKVDKSIGDEDEWELFEYNFNQVHEDFFIKLKEKHPNLTHKDLKICAYIKMNLLSKEIAPLMNVSIRGLETHRYRLKRKLNLDNDNSLSDYLNNFS